MNDEEKLEEVNEDKAAQAHNASILGSHGKQVPVKATRHPVKSR